MEDWLARQSVQPLRWMALFAALLAIQISPWWYPTPDAADYLSIARSIAVSHRLSNMGGVHLAYPPGYPLLISPAFLVSARPFLMLSLMQWLMAMIFMAGVYRWTRRVAPEAALLLTGLAMVNVALWIYYRRTLSELAFMTVTIWTVIALDGAIEAADGRSRAIHTAIGTVAMVGMTLIREAGIVFAAGFAVAALLEVRDRKLRPAGALCMIGAVAAPAVAGVAGFLLYDRATAQRAPSVFGTHLSGFIDRSTPLLPRLIEGLRLQISEAGRLIVPGMFKAYAAKGQWLNIDIVIYLAVVVLIATGWWRLMRRRHDVFAATLPLYFVLYVMWAFDAGTRYLLPVLPVLLVSLWFAIEPFTRWRLRALAALLVLHLAVALGYWTTVEIPRGRQCNMQWAAVAGFASELKDQPGAVMATHPVPECARLMLSFLIDRPVPERTDTTEFFSARWLIVPADAPDPAGFQTSQSTALYKLLIRKDGAR